MSDSNGGRWINDEQYIAPYDVVMELNNLKTIAFHLGEDKRDLLEANTKLVGAINLIRETLYGGEVRDLHQIINSALDAHNATIAKDTCGETVRTRALDQVLHSK